MAYSTKAKEHYTAELSATREAGLYKDERVIHSPQGAEIEVEFPAGAGQRAVINLCANNYLHSKVSNENSGETSSELNRKKPRYP